jgi:hypothetical protein
LPTHAVALAEAPERRSGPVIPDMNLVRVDAPWRALLTTCIPLHDRRRSGGTPELMKRKILASLFVISAVIGLGVFATGAYFTDTITQDNYTFTTGSADLKLGFCGGGPGTDCSGVAASIDNITFSSPSQDVVTGPGKSGIECIVIENKGEYALSLSSQLYVTAATPGGMGDAFQVAAESASSNCFSTGVIRSWASAYNEQAAGLVSTGITLAPGARLYVLTENRWDSTGDQNGLQNGTLKLKTVIEGRTV